MVYIVSVVLVYSLLMGVHHSVLKGKKNRMYAVLYFTSTGVAFFLIYSGVVR